MTTEGTVIDLPIKETAPKKKITRKELKKQQLYIERRNRLINTGVSPAEVDNVMAKEDYASLPVEKKISRLEKMFVATVTELAKEMNGLKQNDNIICDAIEINFRAIGQALNKVGLAPEVQQEILKIAEQQVMAERQKQFEAKQQEMAAAQNTQEQATVEQQVDVPGEAAPVPEEATTFGG